MGVSMYALNILYNNRVISDLEFKIEAIDRRIMAVNVAAQTGQMSIFEAHAVENMLIQQKHNMEAQKDARQNMLEKAQKEAKEEIKSSFTINA